MTADQAITEFTERDWVQAAAHEFFQPLPEVPGSIYDATRAAHTPPQERRRAAPQPTPAHKPAVA